MLRRCVFLDRDGVINEYLPGDWVRTWPQFRFLPNIADWIRLFNALGYLVIVITNQRGIALGRFTLADLEQIHARMLAELAAAGARIDDIFICPHDNNECDCRKPQPGLIHAAQRKWQIDLAQSLFIGDSESDRDLAAHCGIPFLRAHNGRLQMD